MGLGPDSFRSTTTPLHAWPTRKIEGRIASSGCSSCDQSPGRQPRGRHPRAATYRDRVGQRAGRARGRAPPSTSRTGGEPLVAAYPSTAATAAAARSKTVSRRGPEIAPSHLKATYRGPHRQAERDLSRQDPTKVAHL